MIDRFNELLLSISTELINSHVTDAHSHIVRVLAALGEFGGHDRCYVFEFNEGLQEMSNTHEWVRGGIAAHQTQLQSIPRDDLPWFFSQMEQYQKMVVDDVTELPDEAAAEQAEFVREDIRSVVCVGYQLDGELHGFVGCDVVARVQHWDRRLLQQLQVVAGLIAAALGRLKAEQKLLATQAALEQANRKLAQQVREDSLTGVANRRALDSFLRQSINRCSRVGAPITVMLMDLDNFKSFNDQHGHLHGDELLQQVADVLKEQFRRDSEIVARFGGDEFVVVSSEPDAQSALDLATAVLHKIGVLCQCKLSVGIAHLVPPQKSSNEMLLSCADRALYRAKNAGRGRAFLLNSLSH